MGEEYLLNDKEVAFVNGMARALLTATMLGIRSSFDEADNPMFEGRDVSSIISWLSSATNPYASQVEMDPQNTANPLVGMTGGSYGGGIQLTTVDPRIKAIIPEIGWN